MKTSNKYLTNLVFSVRYGPQTRLVRGIYFRSRCIRANVKPQTTKRLLVRENSDNIDSHQLKANSVFRSNIIWRDLINPKWPTVKSEQLFWNYILHILTGAVTEKWMICISLLKPCGDNLTHIQKYSPLLDDWEKFTLFGCREIPWLKLETAAGLQFADAYLVSDTDTKKRWFGLSIKMTEMQASWLSVHSAEL